MDKAVLYLRIYYLGMPALAIYNFGNAVYSAVGNTKKPLYYLGFSGVLNIILNLFFVIACRMDVAGVALASIISQYVSAVLILQALLRSKDIYALHPGKLRMDRELTRDILKLGMPSGLQNVIFQFANSFVQMGVNSFDAIMVAGNSAASNADALVYDVMAAFYTACGSWTQLREMMGQFVQVYSALLERVGNSGSSRLVQSIRSAIHADLRNASLSQVADTLNMSPSYISMIFKEKTGQNFKDYLFQTRMNHAKRLLRQGMAIGEIARQLGYEDTEHFSRRFRAQFGLSPMAYRKEAPAGPGKG